MGGEAIGELLPATRILVLELDTARAKRIHLREFLGALLFEIVGNLQRDAAKILLVLLLAAIAGASDRERARALRRPQAKMHGAEAAHRKPHYMRLVDVQRVEHGNGIVGSDGLRMGVDAVRHVRRRIAACGIGDASVTAAEKAQLRLPACVIAAEFMNEKDRRALARLLHMELHAILGGKNGNRSIPFRIAAADRSAC